MTAPFYGQIEKRNLRQNLTLPFVESFDCMCIIDWNDTFIGCLNNFTAQEQTWSNYKHNNICKYLIGISPAGAMMFLSEGWGGNTCKKEKASEFVKKVTNDGYVLADRGFLI